MHDERIVPSEVFAGIVLVCLATSIVSPIVLRRLIATQCNSPDSLP